MSNPLRPASLTVGTSGTAGLRAGVVTASARIRPAFTLVTAGGIVEKTSATSPASSACTAGALPLYGTWIRSTPAMVLNVSPDRCNIVPLPEDAYGICPGRDLASAISSLTDFTGRDGCTTSMSGLDATSVIGVKSLTVSYGSFL